MNLFRCILLIRCFKYGTGHAISLKYYVANSDSLPQDSLEEEWGRWLRGHNFLHLLQQHSLPLARHRRFFLPAEELQSNSVSLLQCLLLKCGDWFRCLTFLCWSQELHSVHQCLFRSDRPAVHWVQIKDWLHQEEKIEEQTNERIMGLGGGWHGNVLKEVCYVLGGRLSFHLLKFHEIHDQLRPVWSSLVFVLYQ